jgi:transposase
VFPGNTADPTTFTAQVARIRERFGLRRVVLVGDRGMITSARIEKDLRGVEGLDWITALRNESIQSLADKKVLQPSLFDERDLAEVVSTDHPGERLVVCRNPLLADERARKRGELLATAQTKLDAIVKAVARERNPLRGKARIGLRVGRELQSTKMLKHFELTIEDEAFSYRLREEEVAQEAALDGIYVIRTSVSPENLTTDQVVAAYKGLSQVEWAFRTLKTTQLQLRPIYHWKDERIRAHVFLCMLAYYVEWHMRRALSPLLFQDHERAAAEATRASIVRPAPRSEAARGKEQTKHTADGIPVQSFRSLLKDLSTICRNTIRVTDHALATFERITLPTPAQQRAFELLGIAVDAAK